MRLDARIKRLIKAIRKRRPRVFVWLMTNAAMRARGVWLLSEGGYDYCAAVAGIGGDVPDPPPDGCRLISDEEARALIAAGRCPTPVEFVDEYPRDGHEPNESEAGEVGARASAGAGAI